LGLVREACSEREMIFESWHGIEVALYLMKKLFSDSIFVMKGCDMHFF
jgi:hypothetical protein